MNFAFELSDFCLCLLLYFPFLSSPPPSLPPSFLTCEALFPNDSDDAELVGLENPDGKGIISSVIVAGCGHGEEAAVALAWRRRGRRTVDECI